MSMKVSRCEFVHGLKCEQVSRRITELESENDSLREQLHTVFEDNAKLRERFDQYDYKMGCLLCDLTGNLISKAETTANNTICEIVNEYLTQGLKDENEKLLGKLERENKRLKSDNARLRKLARRFAEYVSQDCCEECMCKLIEIRDMARELGIEVDA